MKIEIANTHATYICMHIFKNSKKLKKLKTEHYGFENIKNDGKKISIRQNFYKKNCMLLLL